MWLKETSCHFITRIRITPHANQWAIRKGRTLMLLRTNTRPMYLYRGRTKGCLAWTFHENSLCYIRIALEKELGNFTLIIKYSLIIKYNLERLYWKTGFKIVIWKHDNLILTTHNLSNHYRFVIALKVTALDKCSLLLIGNWIKVIRYW